MAPLGYLLPQDPTMQISRSGFLKRDSPVTSRHGESEAAATNDIGEARYIALTSFDSARADLTDYLAEIVMTTLLDVSRLTADQIAGLQKDGNDLRRFKNAVASIAAQLPDISNFISQERTIGS
jgi:hypothetical protein